MFDFAAVLRDTAPIADRDRLQSRGGVKVSFRAATPLKQKPTMDTA